MTPVPHKHHRPFFRPELQGTMQKNQALKSKATYASITVGLILFIVKAVGWYTTDSVSLLSSLADSGLDLLASFISLLAVRHAMLPRDREHRFGHGKLEALAALVQSIVIIISSFFIIGEAIDHFKNPKLVQQPTIGIAIMVLSIFLTLVLVWFQSHVILKTNSVAIKADFVHYKSDLYLNFTIILSLILTQTLQWPWVDPLFGIILSLYIIYTAAHISTEAVHILIDQELPDSDRKKIIKIITSHPKVKSHHQLRTRTSGTTEFIQVHLEMVKGITLEESHAITHEIEALILKEFPHSEFMAHQDPEGAIEDHEHDM